MKKMNRRYILGDTWVECDVCDFGYRASEIRMGVAGSQKGFNVCPTCFDVVHEHDIYKFKHRPEGGPSAISSSTGIVGIDAILTDERDYLVVGDDYIVQE